MKKTGIKERIKILIIGILVGLLIFQLSVIYFANSGTSWALNEQIEMARRFELTGSFYPQDKYAFDLVSPYPPGIAFLLTIFCHNGIYPQYVIGILALVSMSILLLLLIISTKKFHENSKLTFFGGFVFIGIFIIGFWEFKAYAMGLKPDVISLIIELSVLLTIFKFRTDKRFCLFAPLLILFSCLGLLFKQQVLVFVLLNLILVLLAKYQKKGLFSRLSSIIVFFVFFYLYFGNSNIYFFNYKALSFHPIVKENLLFLGTLIYQYPIIFFVLILVVYNYLIKQLINIKEKGLKTAYSEFYNNDEQIYTLYSIGYFLFGCLGMFKYGGNSGNIEVGLLLFVPLIVNYIEIRMPRLNIQNVFVILIIFAISGLKPLKKIKERSYSLQQARTFIVENTSLIDKNSRILTSDMLYMDFIKRGRGFNNIYSLDGISSFCQFSMDPKYDEIKYSDILKNIDYIIFLNNIDNSKIRNLSFENSVQKLFQKEFGNNTATILVNRNKKDK